MTMLGSRYRCSLTLTVNRFSLGFGLCLFILASVGLCQRITPRRQPSRNVNSFGKPARTSNFRTFNVSSLHISYQVSKDLPSGWHRADDHSRRYINFGDGWSTSQRVRNVEELLGQISNNGIRGGIPGANVVENLETGELIRLRTSKKFINSGLIEVYRAGKWGYVCNHRWDIEDATVACRQLGYINGALAFTGSNESLPIDKYWTAEILMDETRCSGNERRLQECPYTSKHNCDLTELAAVTCADNEGCPDGWQSGFGKCYKFFTNARNIQQATNYCTSYNASLVSIESLEENHFLSNIIKNSMPDIHQWYTSGRKVKQIWKWVKQVPNKSTSKNRNSAPNISTPLFKTLGSRITTDRWFPGWPANNILHSEPSSQEKHNCLTLSDQFKNNAEGTATLDYFFWKAEVCTKPGGINFICQYELEEERSKVKECYVGRGLSYRGFASVTEKGTRCLSWAGSPKVNDDTHPGKGLGYHNYCRNPDGDSRPWCWVNYDQNHFGFCKLQKCSEIVETTGEVPFINVGSPSLNCPIDEFYCSEQRICIPEDLRCNKVLDCTFGEDEEGCEYALTEFHVTEDRTLVLSDPNKLLSFASYININKEQCAKKCLASTLYICRSFVYNSIRKSCDLSEYNFHNGTITRSPIYDYYELISQLHCEGKFMCDNGYCVDHTSKCDGKDNCMDHSDERNCGEGDPDISVALVGQEEHAGTVEVTFMGVKGVICDDEWSLEDATVVCRMLGYKAAEKAFQLNHFNYPYEDSVFLLDNVKCHGNETSLNQCEKDPWKTHDCRPFEIAGVTCQADKSVGCPPEKFKCKNKSCVKAEVLCDQKNDCGDNSDELHCNSVEYRLVNGSSRSQGRVEVIRNGLKGTICDDLWDEYNAAVICRKMGFRYGGQVMINSYFGEGTGPIWLDNVNCNGKEASLEKCAHGGWGKSDCSHSEDVGVKCYLIPQRTVPTIPTTLRTTRLVTKTPDSTPSKAYTTTTQKSKMTTLSPSAPFTVSLTGGNSASEGDVIVTFQGVQYRICDDSWDILDANVICKMLNYSDGGIPTEKSFFESSNSLDYLFDNVECKGTESHISLCVGNVGKDKHDCILDEAAGVQCIVKGPVTASPDVTFEPKAGGGICGYKPYEHKDLYSDDRFRRSLQTPYPGYDELTAPRVISDPNILKIVGGKYVSHGSHPWQVRIEKILSQSLTDHHCGGAILNEYWILTAAHCLTNKRKTELKIYVGDHNLENEDSEEQKYDIDLLISHERYIENLKDYDIALIKIKPKFGKGIVYGDFVQPVCLPDENTPYTEGTKCSISGWGNVNPAVNQYPTVLKGVEVPLISQPKCIAAYNKGLGKSYTSRMICAGYMAGGIDTCDGDSGGPLTCKINGVHTLLGITSWGRGCALPNSPGVYANVKAFLNWIYNKIDTFSETLQEKTVPHKS